MSYRGIGDNSAPYGEELRADLEQILSENTENLFIYAQWHVGDYIAGTEGMPLEIEGAYQRFLMRLYRRGKPLPDDDSFMTAAMSLSTRVWRRIKTALIELGKIVVRCGCLTNPRFEKERLKRAEQLRKRAFAAHVRWQQERENRAEKSQPAAPIPPSLPEVSPKFAGSLDEVSPKLAGNFTKNTNKINEPQHAHAYANHKPLTINQEPIEEKRDRECTTLPASTRKLKNPSRWEYEATMSPLERAAQKDVGWTEDGHIAVMNGFEAALARDFPRVNILAGLAAVTGNQLPAKERTSATQLKGAILRQFGFMEQDESGKDRRYQQRAAAAPSAKAKQPPWRSYEQTGGRPGR